MGLCYLLHPLADLVVLLLGVGSAVIDNVPLVAASLGMFSEPLDHELWHFIAYSAGTGGSMLIIGSASLYSKTRYALYYRKCRWAPSLPGYGAAISIGGV